MGQVIKFPKKRAARQVTTNKTPAPAKVVATTQPRKYYIKEWREFRGFNSAAEFSRHAGMPYSSYVAYEKNAVRGRVSVLEHLAKALRVRGLGELSELPPDWTKPAIYMLEPGDGAA